MEGVEGQHSEQSGKDRNPEKTRVELDTGLGDVEARTAELRTAQARVTALEQRLRLIHQSRTYRIASRMWRIRSRTRALFSWRRPKAQYEPRSAEVELAARGAPESQVVAPDEVPLWAGRAGVTQQPDSNGAGGGIARDEEEEPLVYHGSRGFRATDQESSPPLHAVLLLGLTEPQLVDALRALALGHDPDTEPLVITDCDALRTLDSAGYLYEYIPPREDWERHLRRDGDDYVRFLHRRLASIAGMYGLAGLPSIT